MQMRQLLSSILLLFIFGCATQKRCNEKYPIIATQQDSSWTKDSTAIRHDTIHDAGEKVIIHDTIKCPGLEYHAKSTKGRITETIDIHNGKIDAKCKEDSLKLIVEAKDRFIRSFNRESKTEVQKAPDYEHRATKPDIFCYVVTAAVGGWFLYKGIRFLKLKSPV